MERLQGLARRLPRGGAVRKPTQRPGRERPQPDLSAIVDQVPLLGVCYGAQYLATLSGGKVEASDSREYGRANLATVNSDDPLLAGMTSNSQVWMSHGDTILELGPGYNTICSTDDVHFAGFRAEGKQVWGIQFHPEVWHSTEGPILLKNFVMGICGCTGSWTPDNFVESTVKDLQAKIGPEDRVILGLSGGVDSTVAAELLNRAIGDRLHCIFVDNGLLRKNEFEQVLEDYKDMGLNVRGVRAGDQFLEALAGESDPETKRKAIGRVFVEVFDEASKGVEGARWLGQGTIYPDVIESVSATGGPSATIKSHHNVGGLPDYMTLEVVEPLRLLFKDEVRRVGRAMNIKERILGTPSVPRSRARHPHFGRHHRREGARVAGGGPHLDPRLARRRPLRRRVAGGGHPASRAKRGCDGRRADVRERRGPSCREQHRRHDGRLVPLAL